jgi:hypothetical protein
MLNVECMHVTCSDRHIARVLYSTQQNACIERGGVEYREGGDYDYLELGGYVQGSLPYPMFRVTGV